MTDYIIFPVMPQIVIAIATGTVICAIIMFLHKGASNFAPDRTTLLIILGSGGHTTEMLDMLNTVDLDRFFQRIYYISSDDRLSHQKAMRFESSRLRSGSHQVRVLTRARQVKQRWISTPFTAMLSYFHSVNLLYRDQPDLVLCNGPGTCVMLVLACLTIRVSHVPLHYKQSNPEQCSKVHKCRVIFIESFARVKSLSLSGKILLHLADRFLVMWPDLQDKHTGVENAGLLL